MFGSQLPSLHNETGEAMLNGELASRIRLSDDRRQTYISVPMPGQPDGKKPGAIDGQLLVEFVGPVADELANDLATIRERKQRTNPLVVEVVLDSGKSLGPCRVGPYFGSGYQLVPLD